MIPDDRQRKVGGKTHLAVQPAKPCEGNLNIFKNNHITISCIHLLVRYHVSTSWSSFKERVEQAVCFFFFLPVGCIPVPCRTTWQATLTRCACCSLRTCSMDAHNTFSMWLRTRVRTRSRSHTRTIRFALDRVCNISSHFDPRTQSRLESGTQTTATLAEFSSKRPSTKKAGSAVARGKRLQALGRLRSRCRATRAVEAFSCTLEGARASAKSQIP
jgi:hypothetical protein